MRTRGPLQNITNCNIASRTQQRSNKQNNKDCDEHNKENVKPKNVARPPLATIFDENASKRTRKLPDEVMSYYILDFYNQPLQNGKIQEIHQYLKRNGIEKNVNAFTRSWKNSKLNGMKMNGDPSEKAKVVFDNFLKTKKEERKRRNKRSNRRVNKIDTKGEIEETGLSSKGTILLNFCFQFDGF